MKRALIFSVILIASVSEMVSQNLPRILITYNGDAATVEVPSTITDVDVTTDGANVEITSSTTKAEYAYVISGNSSDGSLLIKGDYKLTLILNGLTLTNSEGAAIDIECGKRIAVELVDGTVNTLSDSSFGIQKAALYFSGHPEFEGSGILNVTGNSKHAISSKEYLQLKKNTGIINILGAKSDGIHCGKGKVSNEHNYFLMEGGTVNISNIGSDGIDSDDFGVINIQGGALSISLDSDDASGIKADSILSISSGMVNISVNGVESSALKSSYEMNISGGDLTLLVLGDGSKGLRCKDASETVLNGGYMNIDGGNIEVYALGGNQIVDSDTTKCMAFSVDKNFVQKDGSINLYACGPEAYSYNVKGTESHEGGTFNIVRAPWMINPFTYQYDMSSYIVVKVNDTLLDDYSNYSVGAFVGDTCRGVSEFETSDYGILRIRSNSSTSEEIRFKLYDYLTDKEYELHSDTLVTFKSMDCYGTPSSPIVLSVEIDERNKYDVNEDGLVDISDIVAIINHIAGLHYWRYADVNEDKDVNISDIVSIINYMAAH